jgi:hypothetical protein
VKLFLEVDRTAIDIRGDSQAGYPNSVLVHGGRRASGVNWLNFHVMYLSGSLRMETGVAESTVGGGGGSTAWDIHGMHLAHQVLVGGDRQRFSRSDNGFRERRSRWGRIDVGFGVY